MPLLAEGDVTVHKLFEGQLPDDPNAGHESVTLVYGDTLEEDQVPKYVLEAVKAGEAGPLRKVTRAEADQAKARVEAAKAEASENQQVINASNADEDREEVA